MRALTLHQPWASLVAQGHQQFETRSRRPPYRQIGKPIAIHAGLTEHRETRLDPIVQQLLGPTLLPKGALLAVALLTAAYPTLPGTGGLPHDQETAPRPPYDHLFGNYSPGRWAWKLVDLHQLPEPIPYRGAMGLWPLPSKITHRLLAEWRAHLARA